MQGFYKFASRFIPAGAGNTPCSEASRSAPAVYPRWRGEHTCAMMPTIKFVGLSPLARGTRKTVNGENILARFIPAGAGNTCLVEKIQ